MTTPDARDYEVIKVCAYCGNEYGGRLGCCGESYEHCAWVTDYPPFEDRQFDTEAQAWRAIEQDIIDRAMDAAELMGER